MTGNQAWYRTTGGHGQPGVVHAEGCSNVRGMHTWRMVDGWSQTEVIDHIATVPWLRVCVRCADRIGVPADHASRYLSGPHAANEETPSLRAG